MNLKAIIFDMDGVIVDTEYQDFKIQKEFIKHCNPNSNYEDKELLDLVGKSYLELYSLLQKFIGLDYDIDYIKKEYTIFSDLRYESLDFQKLFRKDILKIIDFSIANRIKLAVASSSKFDHIIDVLDSCDIRDFLM